MWNEISSSFCQKLQLASSTRSMLCLLISFQKPTCLYPAALVNPELFPFRKWFICLCSDDFHHHSWNFLHVHMSMLKLTMHDPSQILTLTGILEPLAYQFEYAFITGVTSKGNYSRNVMCRLAYKGSAWASWWALLQQGIQVKCWYINLVCICYWCDCC